MPNASVIMIDDNAQDIELVGLGFAEAGCDVDLVTATDGEAGMRLVRRLSDEPALPVPRLVLLDLNLPLVRGPEILRFVKRDARLRSVPVIILTTSDAEKDRQECRSLGADGYLVKPHRLDEYLAMMKKVCEELDGHEGRTAPEDG